MTDGRMSSAESKNRASGVQIALDIILGFGESLLTDATIEGCTEAFAVWNDGLFSFPINMPGTGALLTICLF